MLYPIENRVREVKDLSGIWNFKIDRENQGLRERWYEAPLKDTVPMAVPASFNDLVTEEKDKEHVGYYGMKQALSYWTVGTGSGSCSVLGAPLITLSVG